jgi:hypothetical protein
MDIDNYEDEIVLFINQIDTMDDKSSEKKENYDKTKLTQFLNGRPILNLDEYCKFITRHIHFKSNEFSIIPKSKVLPSQEKGLKRKGKSKKYTENCFKFLVLINTLYYYKGCEVDRDLIDPTYKCRMLEDNEEIQKYVTVSFENNLPEEEKELPIGWYIFIPRMTNKQKQFVRSSGLSFLIHSLD